jgi:hypothetical protein
MVQLIGSGFAAIVSLACVVAVICGAVALIGGEREAWKWSAAAALFALVAEILAYTTDSIFQGSGTFSPFSFTVLRLASLLAGTSASVLAVDFFQKNFPKAGTADPSYPRILSELRGR